jgi:hypothetical protein
MMDLVAVPEPGADEHFPALWMPCEKAGAPAFRVAAHLVHQLGRQGRDAFHHEVFTNGDGGLLGEKWE